MSPFFLDCQNSSAFDIGDQGALAPFFGAGSIEKLWQLQYDVGGRGRSLEEWHQPSPVGKDGSREKSVSGRGNSIGEGLDMGEHYTFEELEVHRGRLVEGEAYMVRAVDNAGPLWLWTFILMLLSLGQNVAGHWAGSDVISFNVKNYWIILKVTWVCGYGLWVCMTMMYYVY